MGKGLSLDEKREILQDIFFSSKSFFNIKEVETLGSKRKIPQQTVKDVLQTLVDDNLVTVEKIGSGNYYWALPSKQVALRNTKIKDLKDKIQVCEENTKSLAKSITKATKGKEETDERKELLKEYAVETARTNAIKAKMSSYANDNPIIMREKVAKTKQAITAANRWTDNVFSIKEYLKNTYYMQEADINNQFQIPSELDYIEDQVVPWTQLIDEHKEKDQIQLSRVLFFLTSLLNDATYIELLNDASETQKEKKKNDISRIKTMYI